MADIALNVIQIVSAVAVILGSIIAYRRFTIDLDPFLTVAFEENYDLRYSDRVFLRDQDPVRELWFIVQNSGKSAATITSLYRKWNIIEDHVEPEPVNWKDPDRSKDCFIPIGGNSPSPEIRSLAVRERKARAPNIPDTDSLEGPKPYFVLGIKYRDQNGQQRLAKRLYVLSHGKMHLAWPESEKYNCDITLSGHRRRITKQLATHLATFYLGAGLITGLAAYTESDEQTPNDVLLAAILWPQYAYTEIKVENP